MEASAEIIEQPSANGGEPEPETVSEHSDAEKQQHEVMFKYAAWVHVGEGARDCEQREDGSCTEPLHFHAWCRVPNQFQHASIREKALAAKARKLRQLRDPESDSRVILDSAIEEMVHTDARELMVTELMQKDFLKDYLAAVAEVQEDEEFKTVEHDQERHRALSSMPEEQRPAEEFSELESHLQEYGNKTQKAFEERQQPLRDSLEARSTEELAELMREQRVEAEGNAAYNISYGQWEQFIGTLKPRPREKGMPNERRWPEINLMLAAAPEVIEALQECFRALDTEASRALKNS